MNALLKTASVFTLTWEYLNLSFLEGVDKARLKQLWAEDILTKVGVEVEIIGQPDAEGPRLLVGNHISYLDIVLLMRTVHNVSFVAKEEVGRWPVIGSGARAAETVFVRRECKERRSEARRAITEGLRQGARIALFPSGTTSIRAHRPWRRGAFEIAHQTGTPIQPFRVNYAPLREAAYIHRDLFPWHLYNLARRREPIRARIEFHPALEVADPAAACERWQNWAEREL